MGLFDINFFNKVIEWTPPDKRDAINIAWLRSLVKPIQFLRDKILGDYRVGSSYPQWVAGTYADGQRVRYKQVVYISTINGNTNQPPGEGWEVYLPSFIGVDERVKFDGIKLTLEYALNEYYTTSFRQPPLVSDIYITTNTPVIVGFVVGETEPYCSDVGVNISSDFVAPLSPFYTQYNFTIHIPVAVYALTNEGEVRGFVNKLIPIGLTYNIVTY